MSDTIFLQLITWFQVHMGACEFTLFYLIFCTGLLLLTHRLAGLWGLYAFNALCLIAANIQVLGLTQFAGMAEPVALGLVTASLSFLGNDIITEHHGSTLAKKGIYYTLYAQLLFLLLMLGGLGYRHHNMDIAEAMQALLLPGPRLVLSSLLAYLVSQYTEVQVFDRLKRRQGTKGLWLRTLLSISLSAFIDTVLFSVLAWVILSPTPVSLSTLFSRYVLMAYVMRLAVQSLSIPCIYLSYYTKTTASVSHLQAQRTNKPLVTQA